MKLLSTSPLLVLGIIAQLPFNSNAQSLIDLIWNLGSVPYGGDCLLTGTNPGLPGFENITDPWIINAHCRSLQGTAMCSSRNEQPGKCVCNQGDDAEYVWLGEGDVCLGKVGAWCSAEKSSFFPDKPCIPFADCVPQQGEGRPVGTCQCLYGYKETADKKCEIDDTIGDDERSTPRTQTTTEPAPREKLDLLPLLGFILQNQEVNFTETCKPKGGLFNHTYCNTYTRTVSCQTQDTTQSCLCNMQEDSVFDEDLNMCVGLVGTWCLTRPTLLGVKSCVKHAICELENGDIEDYSFGTCTCDYGYMENDARSCIRDESVELTTTPEPTTPTTEGGGGGAEAKFPTLVFTNIALVLCMAYRYILI
jgi:hypothetical protein